MKRLLATAVALASLCAAHRAHACGVPDFGATIAAVAEAFASKPEPVATPLLVLGLGKSTEGRGGSVAIGYGWGTRDTGGLFPGTHLTRVLAELDRTDRETSVALTYGWFDNSLVPVALDLGIAADDASAGPTGRLTLAMHGIGVRFDGGAMFGGDARAVGRVQLVVDVMELGGRI